jgi:hypothetical protein
MALVLKDRVKETTTTTGTGTVTLAGAAAGFQSFTAVGDGNQTFYAIVDSTSGAWEVGVGTYTASGTTLSRTTVVSSSNAGSLVNFGAGTKDVFVTYPSSRAVYLDAAGSAVSVLDIGTLGASTANITTANITAGTVSTTPSSANDLVNKTYVDTLIASGIHFHEPVRVESPINLNATYNNGTAGVGATLTNAGTQAALVVDGVTVNVADRVLVYEQTNQTQNGVYVVTDAGSGSTNWVLTRASDADTYGFAGPDTLSEGSTFFVQQGATGAGETYTCNTVGTITFGTTNITFAQISAAQIYSAGTGLTLSGTQFSITNTGTAGTYGSASSVPVFVTNAQGQVTSVTNTPIAISGSAVSGDITGKSGGTVAALTAGTFLTSGGTFDGAAARTFAVDATSANTADKVVARDASGNFSAGTITATLSGSATSATTATNLAGGAANQIPFQAGSGSTSFAVAPSASGQVLGWNGSAFTWSAGTISGIPLGSNLSTLTFGTYLTGTSYNGSGAVTLATNATDANTGSTLVARDASGNFSAGTITAALSGNATTATTATNVSGTVAVANGGTGRTSLTANNVILGNGTSAANFVAPGTTGNVLTSNGTTWTSVASSALSGITQSASPFETSLGYQAGNVTTGLYNTWVGYRAGRLNTTGTNNTALGFGALDANTTSSNSTAIGADALGASTGSDNTAVGFRTMLLNTSAFGSTAVGSQALRASTADQNTALGADAGQAITTGSQNTVIGYGAGFSGTNNLTTGQNNIIIGYNAAASAAGVNNEVTIGNTDITSTRLRGMVELNAAMFEAATITATAATGTINFDARTQSVLYYTSNASANWTLNIRAISGTTLNSVMTTGESMTVAFLVTNGATAYYQTGFQVDGSAVTPKWQGGTAPTAGNASSIDVYVITVIKTANATFTVLASQTKFA